MAPRKNRSKDLLDDFFLTDDNFVEFLLHDFAVLAEFLKHITETTLFSRHTVLLKAIFLVGKGIKFQGSTAIRFGHPISISRISRLGASPGPKVISIVRG